jgi:hypothetical protein
MDDDSSWYSQYMLEIKHAEIARSANNEGRARVCARRAAGIVIKEFLQRSNMNSAGMNVFDLLKYLHNLNEIPPDIKEVISHLLQPVSTEHTLPTNIDLLADVNWLKNRLLGEINP